jgi:hypothetical protein
VRFFHVDDLLPVRWRDFKVRHGARETTRGDVRTPSRQVVASQAVTPTYPWTFDVTNDPKELWNIGPANTRVGEPVARIGAAYQGSLKDHPNIPPGAEGPKGK